MRITHELGLTSHKTADGTEYEADADGYIDVPDDVAKGLLRQPGWSLAEQPVAEPAKAPAAPAPDPQDDGQGKADEGGGSEPEVVDLEALDREALDALAQEHGVEVSARWGDKRVRATLAAAGVGA